MAQDDFLPEADVDEQRRRVVSDEQVEPDVGLPDDEVRLPDDAPEGDALEQAQEVPDDDGDYRED